VGDVAGTAFQQWLGLRWAIIDPERHRIVVEMDLRDDLCGPNGTVEGGVVSTLVDVAGASAGATALGRWLATEHISVSFLAPGRVGPIRASAELLRAGQRDAVSEVRVVDVGRDDQLMAVALVTLRQLRDRS
jgi:uncharacterized protein (TIGR00369 family)